MERNVSEKLATILAAAAKAAEPKPKSTNPGSKPKGGNRYVIFDETKIREKLSKQAVYILMKLADAGEKGLTKKELATMAIADGQDKFPTNQPHERAIGFYLSEFKSEGSLAFAKVPVEVPADATSLKEVA